MGKLEQFAYRGTVQNLVGLRHVIDIRRHCGSTSNLVIKWRARPFVITLCGQTDLRESMILSPTDFVSHVCESAMSG